MPQQVYQDLAWGGLSEAPVFEAIYPVGNPNRQRILNRYEAEQRNLPIGVNPNVQNPASLPVINIIMKKHIFILSLVLLFSCSAKKSNKLNSIPTDQISIETKLTETELNIINDFIDVELKKERYLNYKDFEIVIIEEALKKYQSVETYIYSYDEWISMNKIDRREDIENRYFLDSLYVKKIKLELENEEIYNWKVSDFKTIKVSLLKYEDLIKIIRTNAYGSTISKRLIIYLSKPLIIDKNNALISFEIGNGQLGFKSINHLTVLMKKLNNKWEQSDYYYDGVFN